MVIHIDKIPEKTVVDMKKNISMEDEALGDMIELLQARRNDQAIKKAQLELLNEKTIAEDAKLLIG